MNGGPEKKLEFARESPEESDDYQRYLGRGGILNAKDYESVLSRVKGSTALDKASIEQIEQKAQVEFIAETADITHNEADGVDKRAIFDKSVAIYGILRNDKKPVGVTDHYTQMSDQQIFAEALRMVGDDDSLQKLISRHGKHKHISFSKPEN